MIDEKKLLQEIENTYDLNYGEKLINPNEFYDLVDEQPQIGRWIPVSERLPKETSCVRVLVTLKNECVCEAFYILSEFKYTEGHSMKLFEKHNPVIAWQPLPEPYNESV